jgi:O-acetyl-ADP-ribose deacetylase (regulator of RNase III)
MIAYVHGSLFESPAKVLVNTVNTVGVMGKGIAKTFKQIYPRMFEQYQEYCENGQLEIGKLFLYKTPHKWVLNFPTKKNWRQPSEPEYIERGLQKFVDTYAVKGITSIAFPELGCGNGGLDWEGVVRPLMEQYLGKLPIDVFIYVYDRERRTPEHLSVSSMSRWLHSEPQALPFDEVWLDLASALERQVRLCPFSGGDPFTAQSVVQGQAGIVLHGVRIEAEVREASDAEVSEVCRVGADGVLIPRGCLFELWQNIRSYGFCTVSVMPASLAGLADYVMAALVKLPYLVPVKISSPSELSAGAENGLRLHAPPARPSQSQRTALQPVSSV